MILLDMDPPAPPAVVPCLKHSLPYFCVEVQVEKQLLLIRVWAVQKLVAAVQLLYDMAGPYSYVSDCELEALTVISRQDHTFLDDSPAIVQ